MNTLLSIHAAIPAEHRTDKGTRHSYIEWYEGQLFRFRDQPVTLLEIGVHRGKSLRLWEQYFTHPNARFIGVDIKPVKLDLPRTAIIQCDINHFAVGFELDIVIDDGSHKTTDQIAAFRLLWPKLTSGGLYVIEDVQRDAALAVLTAALPELTVEDRRNIKGRYDDILLWGVKP